MLKIRHFSKLYDNKPAVDDLSLEVNAGDIYAFIGHNGAGKTTTIKACCGILQFEQGDIFVNGLSVKDSPIECKKQMAYIPDNPELYEYLSGIKYLNFVADIYGVGKKERSNLRRCLRPHRGSCPACERILPRHEAEARHYFRMAARPEAHHHG